MRNRTILQTVSEVVVLVIIFAAIALLSVGEADAQNYREWLLEYEGAEVMDEPEEQLFFPQSYPAPPVKKSKPKDNISAYPAPPTDTVYDTPTPFVLPTPAPTMDVSDE